MYLYRKSAIINAAVCRLVNLAEHSPSAGNRIDRLILRDEYECKRYASQAVNGY